MLSLIVYCFENFSLSVSLNVRHDVYSSLPRLLQTPDKFHNLYLISVCSKGEYCSGERIKWHGENDTCVCPLCAQLCFVLCCRTSAPPNPLRLFSLCNSWRSGTPWFCFC